MTYTYAILEISKTAFDEIAAKLGKAGYDTIIYLTNSRKESGSQLTI